MYTIKGINHINVVVPEIDEATRYYADLLGAVPIQSFPRFKNVGFAKSAGFLLDPQSVSVTVRFLTVPPQNAITLELMEYHEPPGQKVVMDKHTNDIGVLGHISLSVENIDEAFEHVKQMQDTKLISDHPEYQPFQISEIGPDDFILHDPATEADCEQKAAMAEAISRIHYFYFIDKYGIQWELEEGH